jgi:hypothetical protein
MAYNKAMRGLIDGILFGLATLFLIRLYTTNNWFYRQVNQIFLYLEKWHMWMMSKASKGLRWFVVIGFIFIGLLLGFLLLTDYSFFTAILSALLIFIPGVYAYFLSIDQIQGSKINEVIELINLGKVSKKELEKLKQAIKDFYGLVYAPSQRNEKPPSFLVKLGVYVFILVRPRLWPRFIIPQITKLSLFSPFFLYSPFHHRHKPYFDIYDTVFSIIYAHPFRLQIKQFFIDQDYAFIKFNAKHKHSKEIAINLAREVEKKHNLQPMSLLVTEHEGIAKLYIPHEAIFKD